MTHKTLRLTLPFVLLAAIACKKQDEPVATAGYQPAGTGAAGAAPSALPSASAVPTTPAPAPTVPPPPPPLDPAIAAAITPLVAQAGATQTVAGSKALGAALIGNVGGGQAL